MANPVIEIIITKNNSYATGMYFDDGSGNENGLGALVNYCTQQLVNGRDLPEAPPIGEREVSDIVYIGKQ